MDTDGSSHLYQLTHSSTSLAWFEGWRAMAATWRSVCIHQMNRVNSHNGFGRDDTTINIAVCIIGRPFGKRFALRYQTRCLSCPVCLSVTLVYCGQTVGWIKMKRGMRVGLGPGHIVLDGPSCPSHKEAQPSPHNFGPYLLWPNGCMDQDATW